MKLYDLAVLPLLIVMTFGYGWSVMDRTSHHGSVVVSKDALLATIKADLAKFEPSSEFVYNN